VLYLPPSTFTLTLTMCCLLEIVRTPP